ncbi:Cholera toxin secretion protein epsM [Campylobacter jejuni]|nr:Cholera toxin secretion protein epsM [Campylobacter jejuni]
MIGSGWHQRLPRERLIIMVGGTLATLLVLYFVIWQPLAAHRQQQERQVAYLRHQLTWMREQAPRLRGKTSVLSGVGQEDDVAQTISRTGRQYRVPAQRIESKGIAVEVFYAAPQSFEQLARWFEALEREYAVRVVQLEMDAGQTGYVTVKRLRFIKSAAP